jgi:hypothetical protein
MEEDGHEMMGFGGLSKKSDARAYLGKLRVLTHLCLMMR